MVYQRSKSGLFLIELIIAIVFFAVSSAICIQLFVKAHLISTRSADISAASLIAQNYAERYKGLNSTQREDLYFRGSSSLIEDLYYGYDEDGTLVTLGMGDLTGARYLMRIHHDKSFAPALTARIDVYKFDGAPISDTDTALFSLDVKSYSA